MDASFGPNQLGTNEALINNSTLSQTSFSLSKSINDINRHNQSIKRILKPANIYKKHDLVPTQYIKHNNETNLNECTIQSSIITQENNVITPTSPVITSTLQSINPNVSIKDKCLNTNSNDCHLLQNHMDINRGTNSYSVRSVSSPQLTIKPVIRSKVYRKTSLKSMNLSNAMLDHSVLNHRKSNVLTSESRIINISNCSITSTDKQVPFSCLSGMAQGNNSNDRKNKWNMGEVHITCNPLSTPYPYSTPHHNIMSETVTEPLDDEPKSRSCGNFLPILSLIPQTVISFQYLSPKMKFSWWRNKIS
ncbi:PREDICTED: uncharacterized protein LOC108548142 isoform X1 [Eufriesea mexicana]|nr:PREDICTED: uncharacterized protein LOC108548142 isoform X1 [Eufriesea mexicana]XP_017756439.1 PREDICTED: uncharacterized protein LOC108548142 isoform X1 [Eufriesea mexicana]